jgi:hypothetical protein
MSRKITLLQQRLIAILSLRLPAYHLAGHLPAGLCTAPASLNARFHIFELRATGCTCLTDLRTHPADFPMMLCTQQHHVCARLTHLCATEHQAKMGGFNVPAAHLETMQRSMLEAFVMALVAGLNTCLHF